MTHSSVMSDEVVLAIGGGGGIGLAAVDAFLTAGARVVVLERSEARCAAIRSRSSDALIVVEGDATRPADHERAVTAALATFGRIDVVACFAAVFDLNAALVDIPAEKLEAAFFEVFSLNVLSGLFAVKSAFAALCAARGSVVLTVSGAGFAPGGGGVLYTSSKYAVRGLVAQLAHELAPVVRVNAVSPGPTASDIRGPRTLRLEGIAATSPLTRDMLASTSPLDYDPSPETHAAAYLYLGARRLSGALTGEIIRSDGGQAVRGPMRVSGRAQSTLINASDPLGRSAGQL